MKTGWIPFWQPKPVIRPHVDHDLPKLTALERAAEVIRYMLHRFEFWVSPKGSLREFIRFNVRLALLLAIPALTVAPLITLALEQFQLWMTLLAQTVSGFVLFPLSVVLSILLVCGMIYIIRSLLDLRGRRYRDGYH